MIKSQTMPTYELYRIHPKLEAGEALNRILRGEISAVEAYRQVMEKITGTAETVRLGDIVKHHEAMVVYWKNQVEKKDLTPDLESGPWGTVVEAFIGTAKLFGSSGSIKALKTGEDHGLSEYKNFLDNEFVSEANKRFVRETAIPQLELHIASLEAMTKLQ